MPVGAAEYIDLVFLNYCPGWFDSERWISLLEHWIFANLYYKMVQR